jgi:predicted DNA-binding transcriptional regulator AlpA
MPSLSAMLDDLGSPQTAALARALGVSASTARRWIAAGTAPRSVLVSIFWLTRWGRSAVDAESHNAATLHASHARLLRDELIAAQRQIARLRRALDAAPTGAANAPVYSDERLPSIESVSR